MTATTQRATHAFNGTFTPEQTKTHRFHPFTVPAGASAVDVQLDYAPERGSRHRNKLTVTLFDTEGFRGEAHRGGVSHKVHVDVHSATPGFIPGRLPAGEWTVRINAQAVVPSEPPLHYTVRVDLTTGAPTGAETAWLLPPVRVLSRTPGWYRGELHSHTVHSDGRWTLAEMWQRGRELGLDFIALTDHNTISGIPDIAGLPAERPLVIPGMEITSFRGHALAIGATRWIDWRCAAGDRTSEDWIDDVHAAGGLFAIPHTFTEGDPGCTGCNWEHPLPKPGPSNRIEALEICNEWWGAPSNDNPMCLALWRRLLTPQGGPTAIAGTDAHGPNAWFPGAPWAWIYADELSAAGIMDGIRKGRVIITFGPWFTFSARAKGRSAASLPGSHVTANDLVVHAAWRDAPAGAQLRVLSRNQVVHSRSVSGAGEMDYTVGIGEPGWVSAELWSEGDTPLAIANPVYVLPAAGA